MDKKFGTYSNDIRLYLILDVICISVTKDITPLKKNPKNKICNVLDWEQNKKWVAKSSFFLVARPGQ